MALIACPDCAAQVSDKAVSCPSCGHPIAALQTTEAPSKQQAESATTPQLVSLPKSRGIYIILGILFGGFGFHNFYSGYYLTGFIRMGLFMTIFLMEAFVGHGMQITMFVLSLSALWAILEMLWVDEDSTGRKFVV